MASAAQTKMVAVGIMMAILFVGIASANKTPQNCVEKTTEVPDNPCICSKNCACAGKCILNKGGAYNDVKECFIDCVLKNDCLCPQDQGDSMGETASA